MKYMKTRKGQMSFDLAFAIVMILTVLLSITLTSQSTEKASEPGRMMMQLNTVADHTYRSLHSFYNSLVSSDGNSSYTLELPETTLLIKEVTDPVAAGEGKVYSQLDYEVQFDRSINVRTEDQELSVSRGSLNFDILCGGSRLSTAWINGGNQISFVGCSIRTNGDLDCSSCSI